MDLLSIEPSKFLSSSQSELNLRFKINVTDSAFSSIFAGTVVEVQTVNDYVPSVEVFAANVRKVNPSEM